MFRLARSRVLKRSVVWSVALLSCRVCFAGRSSAWVIQHRDIAVLAVQQLDPERRAILDWLWAEARAGHEQRLCEQPAEMAPATKPSCIDWAAWPAVAADHSCSAENMVHTILTSGWILAVADIAADLKTQLAGAKNRSQRVNALRNSDLRLQRADQNAVRAGANNAHFLLARASVEEDGLADVTRCLSAGAELNALVSIPGPSQRAREASRALS